MPVRKGFATTGKYADAAAWAISALGRNGTAATAAGTEAAVAGTASAAAGTEAAVAGTAPARTAPMGTAPTGTAPTGGAPARSTSSATAPKAEARTRQEPSGGSPAESGHPRRHRRLKRLLGLAFEVLLGIIAAVIISAAIGAGTGWWHFEVIESGSMTPALRAGGVAIVQAEPVSAVRVGQIIAVHPPGEPNIVRIHRVIALTHRGNQVWARTKGDANQSPDPGPVRLLGSTAYAEHYFIPYAGYFGVWLYKHSTRQILEVVLFALIVAGGLVLIWGKDDGQRRARAHGARAHGTHSQRQSKPDAATAAAAAATASAATASAGAAQIARVAGPLPAPGLAHAAGPAHGVPLAGAPLADSAAPAHSAALAHARPSHLAPPAPAHAAPPAHVAAPTSTAAPACARGANAGTPTLTPAHAAAIRAAVATLVSLGHTRPAPSGTPGSSEGPEAIPEMGDKTAIARAAASR